MHKPTFELGQTLIEIMVALLFVAVGVIALIKFQNYLSYDNSLVQQKNEATILAIKQIETLKNFQVLNNISGYTSYQSIASSSSTSTGSNATYTIATTVTTNTNPDYKVIDVSVTWTDRSGTSQSVRFISNIAGIDPENSAIVM